MTSADNDLTQSVFVLDGEPKIRDLQPMGEAAISWLKVDSAVKVRARAQAHLDWLRAQIARAEKDIAAAETSAAEASGQLDGVVAKLVALSPDHLDESTIRQGVAEYAGFAMKIGLVRMVALDGDVAPSEPQAVSGAPRRRGRRKVEAETGGAEVPDETRADGTMDLAAGDVASGGGASEVATPVPARLAEGGGKTEAMITIATAAAGIEAEMAFLNSLSAPADEASAGDADDSADEAVDPVGSEADAATVIEPPSMGDAPAAEVVASDSREERDALVGDAGAESLPDATVIETNPVTVAAMPADLEDGGESLAAPPDHDPSSVHDDADPPPADMADAGSGSDPEDVIAGAAGIADPYGLDGGEAGTETASAVPPEDSGLPPDSEETTEAIAPEMSPPETSPPPYLVDEDDGPDPGDDFSMPYGEACPHVGFESEPDDGEGMPDFPPEDIGLHRNPGPIMGDDTDWVDDEEPDGFSPRDGDMGGALAEPDDDLNPLDLVAEADADADGGDATDADGGAVLEDGVSGAGNETAAPDDAACDPAPDVAPGAPDHDARTPAAPGQGTAPTSEPEARPAVRQTLRPVGSGGLHPPPSRTVRRVVPAPRPTIRRT